ncbi:MAG: DUF4440 domain-containing protein [bacterium]|nr:DUF4440 domain-containing protein [bacterium]
MCEQQELLQLSQRLIDCIVAGDWQTYESLCDPALTAFEPEALGHQVAGLPFHRFYFELGTSSGAKNATMIAPQVRMLGADAALITYVRLTQQQTETGPVSRQCEETRVWQRRDGRWWHVHFHRSINA